MLAYVPSEKVAPIKSRSLRVMWDRLQPRVREKLLIYVVFMLSMTEFVS